MYTKFSCFKLYIWAAVRTWLLKKFILIILIIFLNASKTFPDEYPRTIYISATAAPEASAIQTLFEQALGPCEGIIYTKVPRGLIISVDEENFFHQGEADIKLSGKKILDGVVSVLHKINNECTVESHTQDNDYSKSAYDADWELSNARANSIADYLVFCGKVPSRRIFALGYGEIMPFKGNVSGADGTDKRIDFVIFDYELKR